MTFPSEYPGLMSRAYNCRKRLKDAEKSLKAAHRELAKAQKTYTRELNRYADALQDLDDAQINHRFPPANVPADPRKVLKFPETAISGK